MMLRSASARLQSGATRLAETVRHPVGRNALVLYASQIAQYILPLLTLPYLTRVLSRDKFGELAFAHSLLQYFVTLTEFGFGLSATRYIAIHRAGGTNLDRYCSAVIAAKVSLLTLSAALVMVLVQTVPAIGRDPWVVYLTFLNVVGTALFPSWLFQGLQRMEYILYRDIGTRILGVAGVFLFVRKAEDYLLVPVVQFGVVATMGILSLLTVRSSCGIRLTRVSVGEVSAVMRESLPLFLSQAAILLYTTTNTFLLGLLAPPFKVASFSVAQRVIAAVKSLIFPLMTALYPHISLKGVHARPEVVRLIRFAVLRLGWIFALISIGLAVTPPLVVPIMFGDKYKDAAILLQFMAPIPFVLFLGSLYATQYMLGLGYRREWLRLIVSAAVFNFACLGLLSALLEIELAVSLTTVGVEMYILAGAYWFYRRTNADR